MQIILKNQFKIIWKKWFSFIGIFILILLSVMLTNGALSTSVNINNSLKQSNMYQYSIDVDNDYFSTQGFNKIKEYFFANSTLTFKQKKRFIKIIFYRL